MCVYPCPDGKDTAHEKKTEKTAAWSRAAEFFSPSSCRGFAALVGAVRGGYAASGARVHAPIAALDGRDDRRLHGARGRLPSAQPQGRDGKAIVELDSLRHCEATAQYSELSKGISSAREAGRWEVVELAAKRFVEISGVPWPLLMRSRPFSQRLRCLYL